MLLTCIQGSVLLDIIRLLVLRSRIFWPICLNQKDLFFRLPVPSLNQVECKVRYVPCPVDGVIGLVGMQYLLAEEYLREVEVAYVLLFWTAAQFIFKTKQKQVNPKASKKERDLPFSIVIGCVVLHVKPCPYLKCSVNYFFNWAEVAIPENLSLLSHWKDLGLGHGVEQVRNLKQKSLVGLKNKRDPASKH